MIYSAFVEEVLTLAFPDRMARNLISLRERHVLSGLIDLQTKVESLREKNTDIKQGEGAYQCGAMVVQAPAGKIIGVEAYRSTDSVSDSAGDEDSPQCGCIVTYQTVTVPVVKSYANDYTRRGGKMTTADGKIIQMLPVPFGAFGVLHGDLWAYPATLSPWRLRIKWKGIKQAYEPDDEIDLTPAQVDIVRHYVLHKAAKDTGCWQDAAALELEYAKLMRAELLREWENEHPDRVETPPSNVSRSEDLCGPSCQVTEEVDYVEPVP